MYFIMDIRLFAAAFALLPLLAVAFALGKIFSSLLDATARNPSAKDQLFTNAMLGFGAAESIALLAFVISILILFSR